MHKILIIITGSIAAYKTPDIIRELEREGHKITVILTNSGEKFVTKSTIMSLSKAIIYSDKIFNDDLTEEELSKGIMWHIDLAKDHDIIVVLPATANYIANIAHGIANTLSLNIILATKSPIVVFPAMNPNMFSNIATQDNIKILRNRDIKVIEPKIGIAACGDYGKGVLVDISTIINEISIVLQKNNPLKSEKSKNRDDFEYIRREKKKVIITLGSVREKIDPVRFIANTSTGLQGYLIAKALIESGFEVIAVYNHMEIPENYFNFDRCTLIKVENTDEMLDVITRNLPADVFIGCAAVTDYKIDKIFGSDIFESSITASDIITNDIIEKINDTGTKNIKNSAPFDSNIAISRESKIKDKNIIIKCVKNTDIIKAVSLHPTRPDLVVGFSLESEDYIQNSVDKLIAKSLDWIVVNQTQFISGNTRASISDNTSDNMNYFHIIEKSKDASESIQINTTTLGLLHKRDLASTLVTKIVKHMMNEIRKNK